MMSTNYEAFYCAVFSNLLLFPVPQIPIFSSASYTTVLYILIFRSLYRRWENKDAELNGNKYSPNLICSHLLQECNFDLLLSSSNILILLQFFKNLSGTFISKCYLAFW
jgi:hypothetical protein